jgi:hypothetical protein
MERRRQRNLLSQLLLRLRRAATTVSRAAAGEIVTGVMTGVTAAEEAATVTGAGIETGAIVVIAAVIGIIGEAGTFARREGLLRGRRFTA